MQIAATRTATAIVLAWTVVERAAKYRVKRGRDRIATVRDGHGYIDATAPSDAVTYEVAALTGSGRILERGTVTLAAAGGSTGSEPPIDPPVVIPPVEPPVIVPAPTGTDYPSLYPAWLNVTGGRGSGVVRECRTVAELRAALTLPAVYAKLIGEGAWSLGGRTLDVRGNVTIDRTQSRVYFRDGAVKLIGPGNVELWDVVSRPGDVMGDADAIDAVTLNGDIDGVALMGVEALQAPDVSLVIRPVGAGVRNVFGYRVVAGYGLFRSRHAEAHQDADGHGLGANFVGDIGRVAFLDSLFTTSQGRSPRVIMADEVELAHCGFYNYHEPPSGNPGSLHLRSCLWRRGPAAEAVGLRHGDLMLFRFQASASYGGSAVRARSVWIDRALVEGFTAEPGSSQDQALLTSGPIFPLLLDGVGAPSETASRLAFAGPRLKDDVSAGVIADFLNRTGFYQKGDGQYPPTDLRAPAP